MRGLFVTATDTGVGKTVLGAALVAAMRAAGEPVRAHKPVLTGVDETGDRARDGRAGDAWPPDHEILAAAAGMTPEDVAPLRYGPAVSPHLAAAMAGEHVDPARLLATALAAGAGAKRSAAGGAGGAGAALIVEGVGGLLTPLADCYTVCDLAAALDLCLLVAARPGLGTINHTLLTLRAARGAGIDVRAVVLTPWPGQPDEMQRSNKATIERLGSIEVAPLPAVERPSPALLAEAGATLPWRRWLQARSGEQRQPASQARAAATMAAVTLASSSGSITYGGIA